VDAYGRDLPGAAADGSGALPAAWPPCPAPVWSMRAACPPAPRATAPQRASAARAVRGRAGDVASPGAAQYRVHWKPDAVPSASWPRLRAWLGQARDLPARSSGVRINRIRAAKAVCRVVLRQCYASASMPGLGLMMLSPTRARAQAGESGRSRTCSVTCTMRPASSASALPRRTPGAPDRPARSRGMLGSVAALAQQAPGLRGGWPVCRSAWRLWCAACTCLWGLRPGHPMRGRSADVAGGGGLMHAGPPGMPGAACCS